MINMMNLKTTSLALVCALAWLGGLDAAEAKSKTRPNIVFILADDASSRVIRSSLQDQEGIFDWVLADGSDLRDSFPDFCRDERIDLVVMDKSPEAAEVLRAHFAGADVCVGDTRCWLWQASRF